MPGIPSSRQGNRRPGTRGAWPGRLPSREGSRRPPPSQHPCPCGRISLDRGLVGVDGGAVVKGPPSGIAPGIGRRTGDLSALANGEDSPTHFARSSKATHCSWRLRTSACFLASASRSRSCSRLSDDFPLTVQHRACHEDPCLSDAAGLGRALLSFPCCTSESQCLVSCMRRSVSCMRRSVLRPPSSTVGVQLLANAPSLGERMKNESSMGVGLAFLVNKP